MNAPLPDAEFLRRAVDLAEPNALRLAVYQHTRDPELAAMPVERKARKGNPFLFTKLDKAHHETVKQMALALLSKGAPRLDTVAREDADALMTLFCGRELSRADKDYAWGDLAFDDSCRAASWSNRPSQEVLDAFDITIVGAGFGGLLTAIQLQRLGLPFRIIERQSGIGGTWWVNTYPEARVDVTSFLYQFKFELGYRWQNYFPTQAELLDYFDHLVDKYALREHISLSTKVDSARWDDAASKWQITLVGPDGSEERVASDFLISASGQFASANVPEIDGIDAFHGRVFHSTAWDHDFDYTGKRVGLVGTGSTGVQMTRGLAARAASLTVFQRTPNWISRMQNYRDPVPAEIQWLFDNLPGYLNWYVFSQHIAQMRMEGMNEVDPDWVAQGGLFSQKNDEMRELLKGYILNAVKGDRELYEKLVPDWAPLARRPVVDNDFYETLTHEHVELVTGQIQRFTEDGLVDAHDREHPLDLVVLSAGFHVERFLWPVEYEGRAGATLEALWSHDGPRAYQTMLLPGFPNFAMLYGPNSGIVAGSYHSWVELLTHYHCQLIVHTIESGSSSYELRQEAYLAFNDDMDERASRWVFQVEDTGGGYFKNAHGRSSVRLPYQVGEFYDIIARPDLADFDFR